MTGLLRRMQMLCGGSTCLMVLCRFFWKMHWKTGQIKMRTIGILDSGVIFALIALLTVIRFVYISLVFFLSAFVICYRIIIIIIIVITRNYNATTGAL
jgi:hypothetical protein